MPKFASDPLKALALLAGALVCALFANGLARPARRLDWTGWAPPAAAPRATAPAPQLTPPPPPMPTPAPAPGPAVKTPRTPAPAAAAARAPLPVPNAPAAPAPAPEAAFAPSTGGEVIREISSEAALAAFRLKIPFLDARRSADFEAGHVAGAWSVPIWEASAAARITEFEARANPQPRAAIAIYCAGGDCEDSHLLAKKLVELGYRNLLIYRDGFPDWVKQGRPVQRGAQP